jgi:hypothetical protein
MQKLVLGYQRLVLSLICGFWLNPPPFSDLRTRRVLRKYFPVFVTRKSCAKKHGCHG